MALESPCLRNLSISDPAYEHDGVRTLTVFSTALGRRGDISLWLPEGAKEMHNLPLVILLHGVYGSHWCWFQMGGAHRVAAEMIARGELPPMAIACPSDGLYGEGSGYLPLADSNFEQWIGDVPAIVRSAAPCCSEASPLFLSGLSMGGYGTLRIGMRYPERYAAISAHSALTAPEQFRDFFTAEDTDELLKQKTDAWEILHWAGKHREHLSPVRFDCGREDGLFRHNVALHETLTTMGVAHTFEELDGCHEWSYWNANVRRSFRFFAQALSDKS